MSIYINQLIELNAHHKKKNKKIIYKRRKTKRANNTNIKSLAYFFLPSILKNLLN